MDDPAHSPRSALRFAYQEGTYRVTYEGLNVPPLNADPSLNLGSPEGYQSSDFPHFIRKVLTDVKNAGVTSADVTFIESSPMGTLERVALSYLCTLCLELNEEREKVRGAKKALG